MTAPIHFGKAILPYPPPQGFRKKGKKTDPATAPLKRKLAALGTSEQATVADLRRELAALKANQQTTAANLGAAERTIEATTRDLGLMDKRQTQRLRYRIFPLAVAVVSLIPALGLRGCQLDRVRGRVDRLEQRVKAPPISTPPSTPLNAPEPEPPQAAPRGLQPAPRPLGVYLASLRSPNKPTKLHWV